jgi:predicted glycosyltransferase
MFHVQHLLGTGHQQRTAAVARTLASEAGVQVHYVSGGMPMPDLDTGRCHRHQLPPARAADAAYSTLVDAGGRPVDGHWRARRREQLLALLAHARPHLVVTETFPFGRGMLRFELLPLLEVARRQRIALVCSVRDIIEPRSSSTRLEAMAALAREHYRCVLVHGDPSLLPFAATFPPWRRIADLLHYTGYVVVPPAAALMPAGQRGGPVLVSCGGGRVGEPLLRAAVCARRWCRVARQEWEVRLGRDPGALPTLRAQTVPGTRLARNRPGFVEDLARARASVSQAGYNTVAELLVTATPAVLVPYDGEREQGLRAAALARARLADVLEVTELTPQSLAAAVDACVAREVPAHGIRMDGLRRAVQHIRALAAAAAGEDPEVA